MSKNRADTGRSPAEENDQADDQAIFGIIDLKQLGLIGRKIQTIQTMVEEQRADYDRRLKQAEDERNLCPYIDRVQQDHPCCSCGATIPRDTVAVCCVVPLNLGNWLSSEFIAWCGTCWENSYGHVGTSVRDMTTKEGTTI